jgi:hypothetical protein
MQLKNKKGFSELTSFALILSLIVVTSVIAYTYSNNMINKKLTEIDFQNAQNNLKKINEKIPQITNFNTASFAIHLNFKKGQYRFNGTQIYYQSLVKYKGDTYCENSLCHQNINGYERVYINLTNSYSFKDNFNLLPGNHYISFKNLKNETKIKAQIN